MRRVITYTFLTLLILIPLQVANSQTEAEKEVAQAGHALDAATLKQDAAALNLLFAEEYLSTDATGNTRTKEQEISSMTSKNLKIETSTLDVRERRIHVYGNTALETGRFTAKGSYKDQPFDEVGRYTTTWVKRDGRWQIVADHVSLIK